MNITVNGQAQSCGASVSVADLLAARGHDAALVVVERNGNIVPREAFARTPLHEGDSLEIVQFVGGG